MEPPTKQSTINFQSTKHIYHQVNSSNSQLVITTLPHTPPAQTTTKATKSQRTQPTPLSHPPNIVYIVSIPIPLPITPSHTLLLSGLVCMAESIYPVRWVCIATLASRCLTRPSPLCNSHVHYIHMYPFTTPPPSAPLPKTPKTPSKTSPTAQKQP